MLPIRRIGSRLGRRGGWKAPGWPTVLGGLALVLLVVVAATALTTRPAGDPDPAERAGRASDEVRDGESEESLALDVTTSTTAGTTSDTSAGAGADGAGDAGGGDQPGGETATTAPAPATTAPPATAPPPTRSRSFTVAASAGTDRLAAGGGTCAPSTTTVTARPSGKAVFVNLGWTEPDGSSGDRSMTPQDDGSWRATLGPFEQAGGRTWFVAATSEEGRLYRTDDRAFTVVDC